MNHAKTPRRITSAFTAGSIHGCPIHTGQTFTLAFDSKAREFLQEQNSFV